MIRCAIVWWSRISLSTRLVVSHYRKKLQQQQVAQHEPALNCPRAVIGWNDTEEYRRIDAIYWIYNRFFFSMISVFQDFNWCVIIWWSRKSQLQHLVVRKFRKNYKTTKMRQNCPVKAGIGRKIDTFRFFFFWQFFFFSLNSGLMRIDWCAIVWWSRMSLSKRLVVSHYPAPAYTSPFFIL